MKNIDTRRFRIYKSDEDGKWVLLLNGLDINTFRTWSIAYQYLMEHWDCACLGGEKFYGKS